MCRYAALANVRLPITVSGRVAVSRRPTWPPMGRIRCPPPPTRRPCRLRTRGFTVRHRREVCGRVATTPVVQTLGISRWPAIVYVRESRRRTAGDSSRAGPRSGTCLTTAGRPHLARRGTAPVRLSIANSRHEECRNRCRRFVVHGRENMRVGLQVDRDVRVAEPFLHDTGVNSGL